MQRSVRRERFTVQWEARPTKTLGDGSGLVVPDYDATPTVHTQDVEVEVDMGELARRLGTKACRSKGGRAVAASGMVKIRAVKGTQRSRLKGA